MKQILIQLLICLFFMNLAYAADIEVGKDIFRQIIEAGITDNNFKGDAQIGKKVCEAYKGGELLLCIIIT